MLRLTIDTNCINVRQSLAAMNELEVLASHGLVELVTATAMLDDLAFDETRLAQARRDKAYRMLQARGAFMIGHSHVGGDDVVGGPNIYSHIDDIAGALRAGQRWEALDSNSQRDALHLAAHLTYCFDAFVTRDDGVLSRAGQLAALGITVIPPEEAVVVISTRGTRAI